MTASTSWQEYSEVLPAGTKRIAVKYVYNDALYLFLDDFSFMDPTAIPAPNNLTAVEVGAYSATLSWTERGTATAWVLEVTDNDEEETTYVDASTNPYTLTGLNAETEYYVRVRPAGDNTAWSDGIFFETYFAAPTSITATDVTTSSATINWTGTADSYNIRYRAAAEREVLFSEDFENGLGLWTIYTEGEGGGWYTFNPSSLGFESYSGSLVAGAFSWNSEAYDADNWLITPAVALDGILTFYVRTNSGYPDSYEVLLSTGSNAVEDFTTTLQAMTAAPTNGEWNEVSIDLTAYAGQTGYIAIHHVSEDCNYLVVDDFCIYTVGEQIEDWTIVSTSETSITLTGLVESTKYDVAVQAAYGEGVSTWLETSFTTLSSNPVPSDLAADLAADGATITWEGQGDSYNFQYRSAASEDTFFEADFNEGLDGWTLYTEGEGPGWVISSEFGINAATAYSWNGTAYDADNWLISPAVELGGVLKLGVATASQYPDDYEVLLSTTGTNIEDFTTELKAMATATTGTVNIDLSEYSGTGYIAIHHVSSDMYLLAIYSFGIYKDIPAGEWQEMAVTEPTATISGLATNNIYEYQVQSVKGESTSDWSETGDFALLTLDSNADNSKLISNANGKLAYVTLSNRTLYQDNTWNTFCLPFNLSAEQLATSPLADADIRRLNTVSAYDNTIRLNFYSEGYVEETTGGVAYLVKWAEGDNIINPEFANVTITSTRYYTGGESIENEDIEVRFIGTYAPISFTEEDTSILFVGADNKLNWPLAGATIGAMRGYFQIYGTSAEVAGIKQFVLDFGDEEDPTGISELSEDSGNSGNSDWYDLSGRKLTGKPAVKGIYVNGGRKVSVK
mgnify:FL=1